MKWIETGFHRCKCSTCNMEFTEEMFYDNPVFNFCPACGDVVENEQEQGRELCRDNYAGQMEALGYRKDGTPVYDDRARQQTATEIIEEVKEAMCSDYCRYPREYDPEENNDLDLWDSEIFAGCPLNRL